ncbi:SDR family oxidoreductase [Phytoactinopolyspora halotolerans]|uniref:SDR family oxidoreductase n=1 Tax=Phytoactinopolyspora halotolerans TaxID=1981512 RepID=A0A6L9SBX8_9ACTN|nr:SDR family oxidoreductase [Phytoactinopolyspora halotolerans]NEE02038.1 SDR family oxidoreductase [Phytoactinopolyspora halotolerans]
MAEIRERASAALRRRLSGDARRPKTVVVTGASAGIGRAAAILFGSRGDRVGLLARGAEGLSNAADEVTRAGGSAMPVEADVADYDQVELAAQRVESALGPIDIWVNNAFTTIFAPFTEIEPAEYRRVTDVTYHGFVHGTRAALDRMLPRDHGTIVQVGSALAYRGIPLQTAYCGAKHAIQGFTEALRSELLHDGSDVHITMVQLPAVNTPQFEWALSRLDRQPQPVPPIFQPSVAARAILYAADHPRRREYDASFNAAATIAANKLAPGLLDRYLARTGFGAQQTDTPVRAPRPGNLWKPADGVGGTDYGVHGPFSADARGRSTRMWLSRHRAALTGLAATALAAAGAAAATRSVMRR